MVENWFIDPAARVRFPLKSWDFFQPNLLCFVLCCGFYVVRVCPYEPNYLTSVNAFITASSYSMHLAGPSVSYGHSFFNLWVHDYQTCMVVMTSRRGYLVVPYFTRSQNEHFSKKVSPEPLGECSQNLHEYSIGTTQRDRVRFDDL